MKKTLIGILVVMLCIAAVALTACGNNAANFDNTTYTVTFDSQGGSDIASQSVYTGNVVRNPGAPTREGYTFTGWYKSADENKSTLFGGKKL